MINKNSTKEEVLEFASETLKRYREKLLEAVKEKREYPIFTNVIRVLDHDREMVLALVREDGSNLVCLGAEWRGDREVVMEAVKEHGCALKYASEELQGDREFILAAIKQNPKALGWVSDKMQIDIVQGWAQCMGQGENNDK